MYICVYIFYIYINIRNSISNEQGNLDATSTALRVVLSTLHVFATDTRSIFARTNGTEVITLVQQSYRDAETSETRRPPMEAIHFCEDFECDAAVEKNVQWSGGPVTHSPTAPRAVQLGAVVECAQIVILRSPSSFPYVLISKL